MKNYKHFQLILFLFFFQIVCSQSTLKRYKKIIPSKVDNDIVTMTVVSNKITAPTTSSSEVVHKTIFDLSTNGQQSVLNTRNLDEVEKLLNKKYQETEKEKKSYIESNLSTIRLTFSIGRNVDYKLIDDQFNAYDRIEFLQYSFKLDPKFNEVTFDKWNKYNTEYGSLDIGSIEYNRTFTGNIDANYGVEASTNSKSINNSEDENGNKITTEQNNNSKASAGITGKLGYTNSKKENQNIKNRYVQLSGILKKDEFEIIQQGNREIDLAGNVSIEMTVKLPIEDIYFCNFKNLFNEEDLPSPITSVKMSVKLNRIPDRNILKNGLFGTLNYNYAVRHIVKNANTIFEYDDKIQFITGKVSKANVTILSNEDVTTPIYFLSFKIDNQDKSLQFFNGVNPMTIHFKSYLEAKDFRTWLINSIGGLTSDLVISGKTIKFEDISLNGNSVKANINSNLFSIKKLP